MKNKRIKKYLIILLIVILLLMSIVIGTRVYSNYAENKKLEEYPSLTYNETIKEDMNSPLTTNSDVSANEEIGFVEIPRLGMKAPLVQAESNANPYGALNNTIAHDPITPMPGDSLEGSKNSVFLGHREDDFKKLKDVKVGDLIVVYVLGNTMLYEVSETFEAPYTDSENLTDEQKQENKDAISKVFEATTDDTLTLYTCYPFTPMSYIEGRFVVKANRVETFTKNW